MKSMYICLIILGLLGLGAACRIGGDASEPAAGSEEQLLMVDVARIVKEEYVDPVDPALRFPAAFQAMMKTLDPHSAYLDIETTRRYRALLEGRQYESGIWGRMENNRFRVLTVKPGSPAELSGIKPDDTILAASGQSLYSLPDWPARLKLVSDRETDLSLRIQRPGQATTERIQLRLRLPTEPLFQPLDGGGYWVNVARLRKDRIEELASLLDTPKPLPLVIDLRFSEAIDSATFQRFCRLLLPPDSRLQVKMRQETAQWDLGGTLRRQGPMVAVVDASTTHFLEVLAVFCREAGIPLIGRPTCGQMPFCEWFPLTDGSSVVVRSGTFVIRDAPLKEQPISPDEVVAPERMGTIASLALRRLKRTG